HHRHSTPRSNHGSIMTWPRLVALTGWVIPSTDGGRSKKSRDDSPKYVREEPQINSPVFPQVVHAPPEPQPDLCFNKPKPPPQPWPQPLPEPPPLPEYFVKWFSWSRGGAWYGSRF